MCPPILQKVFETGPLRPFWMLGRLVETPGKNGSVSIGGSLSPNNPDTWHGA